MTHLDTPATGKRKGKPHWLRMKLPTGPTYEHSRAIIRNDGLHTVCQEAKCPNIWKCFSRQTATFLILGNRCTRNCRFCAISHDVPLVLDPTEPDRIVTAAQNMKLRHVVITSVTRDDLEDGGAAVFAETIEKIRTGIPEATIEVLIPDFQGNRNALSMVVQSRPDILNHNVETVPRLYPSVRPAAGYNRSLHLLKRSKHLDPSLHTKSGLMLGLGETRNELRGTLEDLIEAGCDMLTVGQYLQPSLQHLPVDRFVHPDEFDEWKAEALSMGFLAVASGPFVRSSYKAAQLFELAKRSKNTLPA